MLTKKKERKGKRMEGKGREAEGRTRHMEFWIFVAEF